MSGKQTFETENRLKALTWWGNGNLGRLGNLLLKLLSKKLRLQDEDRPMLRVYAASLAPRRWHSVRVGLAPRGWSEFRSVPNVLSQTLFFVPSARALRLAGW